MRIRHATMGDLEAITELETLCFPPEEAAGYEAFRERLREFAECFWLLLEGDRLIAMVNGMATDVPLLSDAMYEDAAMHQKNGGWQMIFGVLTHPGYQRQGYASMLLGRVICDAKLAGRKGLVLTCKEALLPFYSEFGFQNEGVSQSVHGGAVWYDMRLTF